MQLLLMLQNIRYQSIYWFCYGFDRGTNSFLVHVSQTLRQMFRHETFLCRKLICTAGVLTGALNRFSKVS